MILAVVAVLNLSFQVFKYMKSTKTAPPTKSSGCFCSLNNLGNHLTVTLCAFIIRRTSCFVKPYKTKCPMPFFR